VATARRPCSRHAVRQKFRVSIIRQDWRCKSLVVSIMSDKHCWAAVVASVDRGE
jgi:hypothetical protein